MNETLFFWLFAGFALIVATGVILSVIRARRVIETNSAIERNQRRQVELSERQVVALERIATALEGRG